MNKIVNETGILILTLVPMILLAIFWEQMPEEVPMHWNYKGDIDRYESKTFFMWFCVGLGAGLYALFLIIPRIDPKKESIGLFKKTYGILRLVLGLFFCILMSAMVLTSAGFDFDVLKVIIISVFGLFVILGNYLPKVRSNYFIGVRTPWTLNNEVVWKKTHQLAGKLWFWIGILGIVGSFFTPRAYLFVLIAPILISTIWLVIYSYLEHKKIKPEGPTKA